ncbi:ATP-grasp domain-containing protein [Paenibacillus sp. IHBB 10380]|uniref:ATP-grasp domain-containing protein n=1 Tax=Paenibacillus sp. IHBB 10380 TaxID=1566358 RepID=UPI0005CFC583|nr:ATP-grasp domain-containing protein [Paenibacillus sp. IHBB 10380]AJS59484.1 carboxylate--amine ligase [Paenibacillus sp. IHBB 10380]
MNSKKIVAFVEPSFYGVSFVRAAYEQGFKIISIVSSPDNPEKYGYEGIYHDLIIADIRDEDSLYEAITNSKYHHKLDALIPATDYASHLTAKVAERLGLKGVPYEAALKSRNKDLAREAYADHDVPSAKFKKIKTYEEAVLAAGEIGYPIVLKPTNASSSQKVFFINSSSELEQAMADIVDFKETYMNFKVREEYLIEEYLNGQEFSVELFLQDGNPIFAAVTEKTTSPLPYFVEIVHTLPTSVYSERQEDIVNTAVSALRAIGLINGPSHVEVKLTDKGPRIIEVNGRPGGDNISSDLLIQALGFDIFKATVHYYLDLPIDIHTHQNRAASVAYLIADKAGTVSTIRGLEHIEDHANVVRSHISVQSGDQIVVPKSSDDRLGYVITIGNTPTEARESALAVIRNIELVYS